MPATPPQSAAPGESPRSPRQASAPPPRLSARLSSPGADHCRSVPPERISDVVRQPGALLWVTIRDPAPQDLEMLREEFGFHRLALEDVAKQEQRPKLDEYPDYYFVVAYAPLPSGSAGETRTVEVDMFVGRNYVVCLHEGEVPALTEAGARWERTDPELRQHVGFLLHTVMDSIIDGYFPVVDEIEDRLDRMELAMFAGRVGGGPEELLAVKRSLFTLRKAIYPLREVFNVFLRRDGSRFEPETYPYFQDVYDHILRLLDIIDIQRDMATGTLDAHLAVISNRLNETMQRLTVLGVCVAILGAVFGAWGMNFERIPLHDSPAGFWIVFGGTVLLVVVILIWAKVRKLW